MIKVRVTKAGVAGASSLVALTSGLSACSQPAGEDAASAASESGLTVQDPGTGTFQLVWAYGTASGYNFNAQNSVDEYVRVGEQMTFSLPGYFLWQKLYPNDAMPSDPARLRQLGANLTAVFMQSGATLSTKAVSTTSWTGTQAYELVAQSGSFVVPAGTDAIRFEVAIVDSADATKTASFGQTDFQEVPVFAGHLPNKTVVFDTFYSAFRNRVVEGGKPVSGSQLSLAYTDWRAATLIDSSSVDRTIGHATSYGRFGSFDMPIFADIQYEISYGASIDGAWLNGERTMTANTSSRALPNMAGRTAFEDALSLPAGAQKLDLYFHVRAYIVADYSKTPNVTWKKYQDGQKVYVAEKWDNLDGKAFQNYDLQTEAP